MENIRHPAEWEDPSPGRGGLPPHAYKTSNAATLDLNGEWRFRFSPTAVTPDGDDFANPQYDDSDWDELPVPSHWVLHGDGKYGRPAYTNFKFPFPLDVPRVPDENPTGEYRFMFGLPNVWVLENGRVGTKSILSASLLHHTVLLLRRDRRDRPSSDH